MKTVMAFGTFDILHPGHLHFLRSARNLGDFLFVVVARDSTVRQLKGRNPQNNEKERLENVRALDFVDRAVLGSEGSDKYCIINRNRPDVICLGYDQGFFADNLEKELKKVGMKTEVVRLKAYKPHKFKTSIIKGNKSRDCQ